MFTDTWDQGAVCSEMRSAASARRWQADLQSFQKEILSVSEITPDPSALPSQEVVELRQYPLFYYLYDYFVQRDGFDDPWYQAYSTLDRDRLMARLRTLL
ncbi:hypothetical protein [Anaerotalea alkaliphila]|uniref:Uncharacterized protein n=1 Tax=Anaerotalea alkaliphila TaxID=2662126 RepID=A0A7X5HTI8_9FIRM|nr:hypothetical protein [Anaerotalea alkaliphila]NDL66398.1 hypothetical protein [Anaerotalea alkaliphila]